MRRVGWEQGWVWGQCVRAGAGSGGGHQSPTEWQCGDHWLHCGVQQLQCTAATMEAACTSPSSSPAPGPHLDTGQPHCCCFSHDFVTLLPSPNGYPLLMLFVILEEVSLSVACVHCHPLPCRAECQCTAATRHSASISSYLGPALAPGPAWWRPFIATSANYPTKETNGIKKSKPMYPQWQPNSIDNDVRGTFLHRKVFVVRTNLRMYTVWFLPYASLSLCCCTAHDEG